MIKQKDLKYFNIAKGASLLSDFKQKVGAVVVLDNEVIAVGYNRRKSHPLQAHYALKAGRHQAIWLHAEMSCLVKLIDTEYKLTNAKIYVFRQLKKGQVSLAKPCEICELALKTFGITQIAYTTLNGFNVSLIK